VNGVAAGLAAGTVYGLLALGIVLVHRASGVVNLAQGAFATLSAYVSTSLVVHGWAFWPALGAAVVLSFAGGAAVHRLLVRPLEHGTLTALTLLTAGLLLAADGLAAWIWGYGPRQSRRPFADGTASILGVDVARRDLGVVVVGLGSVLVLGLVLRRSRIGLGLRAAAANPIAARYSGVHVGSYTTAAWGLSAALGALAGILAAPLFGLRPAMLHLGLLYGLAAAAVAGLDSALPAVPAGLALGVGLELLGRHVHVLHGGVRPAAGLAVLGVALLARRP
jgi:branched-chain amino acid transport system permease protein